MKEEYIIINKTAIQKRIEELEDRIKNDGLFLEEIQHYKGQIFTLKQTLSQSTPLIPEQIVYLLVKVEDELPIESCKCGIIKNGEFDLSYFIKAPSYKVFDHVKSGLSHNQADLS